MVLVETQIIFFAFCFKGQLRSLLPQRQQIDINLLTSAVSLFSGTEDSKESIKLLFQITTLLLASYQFSGNSAP